MQEDFISRSQKMESVRIVSKDNQNEAVSLDLSKGRHGTRYLSIPDEKLLLFLPSWIPEDPL